MDSVTEERLLRHARSGEHIAGVLGRRPPVAQMECGVARPVGVGLRGKLSKTSSTTNCDLTLARASGRPATCLHTAGATGDWSRRRAVREEYGRGAASESTDVRDPIERELEACERMELVARP